MSLKASPTGDDHRDWLFIRRLTVQRFIRQQFCQRCILDSSLEVITGPTLNAEDWAGASYHPTPNIVEAARALYAQHSVEAIACFDAGKQNLGITSGRIEEWLNAINNHFPDWRMFISSRLTDTEYAAGKALDIVRDRTLTHFDDSLHLAVSMRSFRAEHVSFFVKALLDCERHQAQQALSQIIERYPIAITRNLDSAKHWIRTHAFENPEPALVPTLLVYADLLAIGDARCLETAKLLYDQILAEFNR